MNIAYYLLYLMFIFRAYCDVTKGQCSVLTSNNTTDTFCCDDHEFINGSCVACDVGFSAVDRQPCLRCAYPFFGKKCGNICGCSKERCDHIFGCVKPSSTNFMTTGFSRESTTFLMETSSKLFGLEVQSTANHDFPRIGRTTHERDKTTENPFTNTADNTAGLLKREIAIYSLCAATFAITFLLCTAWRHRYKRIYGYYRSHRLQSRRVINNLQRGSTLPDLPVQEVEGIYETIDESNMIDEQIPPNELSNNIVSTERESPPPDDDYLIPCHHDSSDINSSKHSKTPSDSNSSGSHISNIEQNAAAYLNPYQPIVATVDVHQYTKVADINSALSLGQGSTMNIVCESSPPADDYLIPCDHESPTRNNSEHSKTPGESDSTVSPNSIIERNDAAYLNPNKPILSTDVHPYFKLAASDTALCLGRFEETSSSSHRKCQQQVFVLDDEVCEYNSVIPINSILDKSQENLFLDYVEPSLLPQHNELSTTGTQNTFPCLTVESLTLENVKTCVEIELNDVGKQTGKSDTCDVFLSDNIAHDIDDENVVSSKFQEDLFVRSEELNFQNVQVLDYQEGHQAET